MTISPRPSMPEDPQRAPAATRARAVPRAATRRTALRRLLLALGSTATLSFTLLLAASPAAAVVTVVAGAGTVGLQPREEARVWDGDLVSEPLPGYEGGFEATERATSFENPHGYPVLHSPTRVYAIYWDPTDHYHGDWEELINTFLQNVSVEEETGSLSDVFAVDAQYNDRSNTPASTRTPFLGSYRDTVAYPGVSGCTDPAPLEAADRIACLSDAQIQEALKSFISSHGLPTGMNVVYDVLTPPGVTVCVGPGGAAGHCSDFSGAVGGASYDSSFCSYHSDISPTNPTEGNSETILYAAIPWTAGGLGDYHLAAHDEKAALYCQDGGFEPNSKPHIELHENPTVEEEPNQLKGFGPDGTYDHGLADLIINQVAIEQQNMITDPLLDAWQDSSHDELTDECRNFFDTATMGGGASAQEGTDAGNIFNQEIDNNHYYLNDAFNMAALRLPYPGVACLGDVALTPSFTAPNGAIANEPVSFDGMQSNISLDANVDYSPGGAAEDNYATFTWNFGDNTPVVSGYAPGSPPCTSPWKSECASSAIHSYQYGGTYTVSLTVTDVAGNTATVTHQIVVSGPPAPSGGGSSGGSKSTTSGGSGEPTVTTTTGAGSPTSTTSTPAVAAKPAELAPLVSASILSRKLRTVRSKGLVVRYSVNEQVTGHFEVLLATSVAHRLGLHGALATGLPSGTASQTVIGKAILVTTKGGKSTVTIQLDKKTAADLGKLHKVSLMLTLAVRNAAAGTAAALSTVTLAA